MGLDASSQPDRFSYARFLNARRCYGPSFSPDGTRLAFISDLSGVPEAWMMDARGGWPEQLTFVGDRVGFVAFAPNSNQMVIGSDVGGDENVQLARLDRFGAGSFALTTNPSAMHPFGDWSPNGRWIAYSSNERDRASLDIVVQDVHTGEKRTVLSAGGMYQVECWSPDSGSLIVSRVDSSSNNDLYEIDLDIGTSRLLTEHTGAARFQQATYQRDGRTIDVLTDRDGDFLALAELDLGSGRWRTVVADDWDVELFARSPAGRSLAVVVNDSGYSRLALYDARGSTRTTIGIPDGVIARGFVGNWRDQLVWSPDSRRLAFSLTTPRLTQNVWLADPVDASAWPLTHATIGAIPSDALAEPELIHYPTFDGRLIPAFLFRPTGAPANAERPAVVYIHGGPESQSRPGFDPTLQYLANQGYVVLVPNVRGSTGYSNAYSHLDDVEKRMDSVADANAGAAWLASSGIAHPRKIAAMGGSYGGFMVLACLTTAPETWAAGVDLYGVANFVTLLENTHPFRRTHRSAEYGSLEHHRDLLEQISPMTHLHRLVAPLFVAHGERDIRVPISETEQVVAALQARGIPVEFIRLPRAGHGIVSLEDKLTVYPAIASFLARTLQPETT